MLEKINSAAESFGDGVIAFIAGAVEFSTSLVKKIADKFSAGFEDKIRNNKKTVLTVIAAVSAAILVFIIFCLVFGSKKKKAEKNEENMTCEE